MGLKGKFIDITTTQSETETRIITISYPANLTKEDKNYEKRGTTENEEVPLSIHSEKIYENAYIYINSVNFFQSNLENAEKWLVNITFDVFATEEERINNPLNFIKRLPILYTSIDVSKDIISQCYNHVKLSKGLEEMVYS